jgi:hypothetical protein
LSVATKKAFEQKAKLYKALKEKVIRLARTDLSTFAQYVFQVENAPFHNEWQKFVQKSNNGLILGFRGSGKSEAVTVSNTLFEIGRNTNHKIKIVTESEELATNTLNRISATILRNERYHEVFPHVRPSDIGSWNKHSITVERSEHHRDPTVVGFGVTAASTGGRATLIHFDDVCGLRNTIVQPGLREQVKEAFYSNWLPLLDPLLGRWYMTATPWHINDLVTELRNNRAIPKTKEVWAGNNFESPWPERFSSEYFKMKLAEIKLRGYNRAFRGVALSDEETWLNPQAIQSCIDRELKVYDIISSPENNCFTGVDLGHRDGPEACPSVIFTIARTPNGKRIPVEIKISYSSNSLDIARSIINTYENLKPRLIMVENNGAQKYLTDVLQTLGPKGLPLEGHYTTQQKVDPNIGVPSLLAEIETGQWIIPFGSGGDHEENVCECGTCQWIGEVKNYPLAKIDTVMASWLAQIALKKVAERANNSGNFSIWSW